MQAGMFYGEALTQTFADSFQQAAPGEPSMPWKNITKVQQRDTCLALTFLLLLIWLFTKQTAFVYAAHGPAFTGHAHSCGHEPPGLALVRPFPRFGQSHFLNPADCRLRADSFARGLVRQLLGKEFPASAALKKSDKPASEIAIMIFTPEDFNNPY